MVAGDRRVRAGLLALLLAGCARPPAGAAPAAREQGKGWSYRVQAGPGANELAVAAELGPGSGEALVVDEGAQAFVRDVEVQQGQGWRKVQVEGGAWREPSCRGGCRLRYRFALAEAARGLDDVDLAITAGGALLAPPSTWLLRPRETEPPSPLRLRVETPPGLSFVTGLLPSGEGYRAASDDLPESPYSGFGAFRRRTLRLPGGELEVALAPGAYALGEEAVVGWVRRSAELVTAYYGRLPLEHAAVFVLEEEGRGVLHGRTLGNGGASIVMSVGRSLSRADLARDWVMPHELIHLALPSLAASHSWLEEGLSTYIEPIARARAGQLTAEEVWGDWAQSMPQGLPEPGDQGLDHTPTWGRTYWGGALFCLLADVEIRQRTGNERSLDDALRAIVVAGGSVARRWPIEQVLRQGDQATGGTVLRELYERHAHRPVPVDLDRLWASLGVRARGGRVVFDESAPLAAVRAAITRAPLAAQGVWPGVVGAAAIASLRVL